MKSSVFNALPIVASHYANQMGLKVRVGDINDNPSPNTVTIPSVPPDFPNMGVVWGFLGNRCAKVLHCDPAVHRGETPFTRNLVNTFEDIFVEKELLSRFPGVASDLSNAVAYMVEKNYISAPTKDDSPAAAVLSYMQLTMRDKILHQPCSVESKMAKEYVNTILPESCLVRIDAIMRKASSINSTQGSVDLAQQVVQIIQDEAADDDHSTDSNSSTEDQQTEQSSNGPGHELSDGSNQVKAVLQQILNSSDEEFGDDAITQLGNELQTSADENPNAMQSDITIPCQDDQSGARFKMGSIAEAYSVVECAKQTTHKLRAQLLGLVQASQRVARSTSYSGNRIDQSKITRVITGDLKIFKSKVKRISPDTAVHVLVDLSSSMNNKYVVAQQAAVAITLSLESIPGVSPAVTYFGQESSEPVQPMLKHGERLMSKIGMIPAKPAGGTPLAEAMWYAAYQLSKVRNERKIIVVVTDGEPNDSAKTKHIVDLCQNAAIEMIAVGVGSDAVKDYFEDCVVINTVNDLQNNLFHQMKNKLIAAA